MVLLPTTYLKAPEPHWWPVACLVLSAWSSGPPACGLSAAWGLPGAVSPVKRPTCLRPAWGPRGLLGYAKGLPGACLVPQGPSEACLEPEAHLESAGGLPGAVDPVERSTCVWPAWGPRAVLEVRMGPA